jgi:response regulator RpfG family c-di-GMP phosphodiesterase
MSSPKNICIIDDDKIYTFGIKKIIKKYIPHNNVSSFENGKQALDSIQKNYEDNQELPDLILLDIDMPEMNGWEFLNEFEPVRAKTEKKVDVFVISSRIKDEDKLFRVEWDEKVSDFIQKPVEIETLKNLLS